MAQERLHRSVAKTWFGGVPNNSQQREYYFTYYLRLKRDSQWLALPSATSETSPRQFKVVEGLRAHPHLQFFSRAEHLVVSTGDETVVTLGEFPIGTSLRAIDACVHHCTCCVGAVHRSLRPGQALFVSLLASRPPAGMVPTSPDQKSASPAQQL